jgi:hypothetical protein
MFFFPSEEWRELGIEKPGFYSYPSKEYRLAPGEKTPLLKQWRFKSVAARYGGYVGGKTVMFGYSANDNYMDDERLCNMGGDIQVNIYPGQPNSYFSTYVANMNLRYEYVNADADRTQTETPRSKKKNAQIPPKLQEIYDALGVKDAQPTPYQILGVSEDTTKQQMKTAYRTLAKRWHPDRNEDKQLSTKVFQVIENAYDFIRKERNIT